MRMGWCGYSLVSTHLQRDLWGLSQLSIQLIHPVQTSFPGKDQPDQKGRRLRYKQRWQLSAPCVIPSGWRKSPCPCLYYWRCCCCAMELETASAQRFMRTAGICRHCSISSRASATHTLLANSCHSFTTVLFLPIIHRQG